MTPDELEAHPIFEPFIRAVLEQLVGIGSGGAPDPLEAMWRERTEEQAA